MARTVEQIKAAIYAKIEEKEDLVDLFENPSQAKLWGEIVHTVSVNIAIHEQMMDEHLSRVEAERSAFNAQWLRDRILEFQYDATTPQVVELDEDLVPAYPTVDEDLRIVTVCNIEFDSDNLLNIKVAKSDPPVALSAGEITALQDYLTDGGDTNNLGVGVGFAGASCEVFSLDPDYIWFQGEVHIRGEFTATIQAKVEAAIVAYYHTLDGEGNLRTVDLINAILAVEGVTYVIVQGLGIRANATAFASRTLLVDNFEHVLNSVQSVAGYAYEETTASEDLATQITYYVL